MHLISTDKIASTVKLLLSKKDLILLKASHFTERLLEDINNTLKKAALSPYWPLTLLRGGSGKFATPAIYFSIKSERISR